MTEATLEERVATLERELARLRDAVDRLAALAEAGNRLLDIMTAPIEPKGDPDTQKAYL